MSYAAATAHMAHLLVALIFLVSAVGKLRSIGSFETILRQYELMPGAAVPVVARAIPLIELSAAAGLLIADVRAMAAAAALFLIFAAAIAINLWRGRGWLQCGCSLSAGADDPLRWWMVVRNMLLAGVTMISALVETGPVSAGHGIALAVAALTCALLYHALPPLLARPAWRDGRG